MTVSSAVRPLLCEQAPHAQGNFLEVPGGSTDGDPRTRIRSGTGSSVGGRSRRGSTVSSVEGHMLIVPEPEGDQGLSTCGLTTNLTMTILGTTVLGIAAQMKSGGWLLTPVLVCLMATVVAEMTRLVSMTINHLRESLALEVFAYQDFAEGSLGEWGRRWASVTSTGDLIVYTFIALVLEAQSFQVLFPISWPWFGQEGNGSKWWAVFLSLSTVVYSFVDLASLARFASKIGPWISSTMVFLACLGSLQDLQQLPEVPESCRGSAEAPYWTLWPASVGVGDFLFDVASISSYTMFCFAVVVMVPSVQSTMKEPARLGSAGWKAFVIASAAFLSIMALQYAGTGNLGPENLIQGMRDERPAGWWAATRPWETGKSTLVSQLFAMVTTLNLIMCDATYVPCAVIAIETLAAVPVARGGWPVQVSIRLGFAIVRLSVATGVSSFIALSSLTSALFCVSNNILIPILAFHATVGRQRIGLARSTLHAVIFLFGCFIAIFGTAKALTNLLYPSTSQGAPPGLLPRPGVSPECLVLAQGEL
mmetsp:Transcript_91951/g.268896  ORF Transcript_91951/g.268896 Transcript_91951/m.268896 type:complete len:535 (+) Transcript_91951:91-1695(+)